MTQDYEFEFSMNQKSGRKSSKREPHQGETTQGGRYCYVRVACVRRVGLVQLRYTYITEPILGPWLGPRWVQVMTARVRACSALGSSIA